VFSELELVLDKPLQWDRKSHPPKEGQGGYVLRLIILKICFGNVNLIDELCYVE